MDTRYVSLNCHLYTFRNRLLIYMFTRAKRLGVTLSALYSSIRLTLLITYLPFEINYNDNDYVQM